MNTINTNTNIDVDSIRKKISEIHKEMMDLYGFQMDKVNADRQLFLEIISTKLKRVAKCFEDEGVIDTIEYTRDGYCETITLGKSNFCNSVNIVTNGIRIAIDGGDHINSKFSETQTMLFIDIWEHDFNWEDFAQKLLYFIHGIIYSRRDACSIKLFGDIGSNQK